MALLIVFLIMILAITFGSEGIMCMIRRARYRMNHCSEGNSDPNIDIGFTLNRWILETPIIRNAIIWRPDGDTAIPYRNWSRSDKNLLLSYFNRLRAGEAIDVDIEPPIRGFTYYNEGRGDRGNRIRAVGYRVETAKTTFFAHVAQSLRVEIDRIVSWRMVDLPPDQLAYLLDSQHMYSWNREMNAHSLEVSQGRATPGNPARVYRFLSDQGMIHGTARETVLALLEWCRDLTHDHGELDPVTEEITLMPASRDGNEAHWQYEGYQPVERTIAGTVRTGYTTPRHWTGGCQGTTGFLRCLLRVVNIPVRRADGCRHAIPHFLSINAFLSHGDDPYNQVMKNWTPQIPMEEILLDDDRLDDFYRVCRDDRSDVGRGVTEAVIRLLPDQLIEMHCEDLGSGVPRENGQLMASFARDNIDDSYLSRVRFWDRLQEALDRRGGCDGLI